MITASTVIIKKPKEKGGLFILTEEVNNLKSNQDVNSAGSPVLFESKVESDEKNKETAGSPMSPQVNPQLFYQKKDEKDTGEVVQMISECDVE